MQANGKAVTAAEARAQWAQWQGVRDISAIPQATERRHNVNRHSQVQQAHSRMVRGIVREYALARRAGHVANVVKPAIVTYGHYGVEIPQGA